MTSLRPLIVGASGDIGTGFRKRWGASAIYAARTRRDGDRMLDLAQPESWSPDILDGVSHCLIFAGSAKPDACAQDPQGSHKVNVDGTSRLLELCAAKSVVPVFLSSEQVYGVYAGVADELSLTAPVTVYGRQKLQIEQNIVAQFSHFLVLRLSRVEYSHAAKSSLISDSATKLKNGVRTFAYDQMVSLLHIDDLAAMVEGLMAHGVSGVFNMGGPEYLSRSALAALVQARLRAAKQGNLNDGPIQLVELATFPAREPRSTRLLIDFAKARRELGGFVPRSISAILDGYDFEMADA